MNFSEPGWLAYVGSWFAAIGILWTLFDRLDKICSEETRTNVARWIQNVEVGPGAEKWPRTFAEIFDKVFGKKRLSLRCFLASAVASSVTVMILFLVMISSAVEPEEIPPARYSWTMLMLPIIYNFIPHYLSLLATRFAIDIMGKVRTNMLMVAILIADLIVGAIIFLGCVDLVFTIFSGDHPFSSFGNQTGFILSIFVFPQTQSALSILFYASICTSIWLWLYALSLFAVRAFHRMNIMLLFFKKLVDVKTQPLRSIGFVATLIVSLVYLIAAPFVFKLI